MELKYPTREQLRRVYATDLTRSFLPAELKPLYAIEEMWAEGRYQPLCLFDGEKIVGECFLWQGNPGWVLLDYLCVSQDRRNAGLGNMLLHQLHRTYPHTVILGEVEAPEHAENPVMAERRLAFYQREHARLAGYDAEIFGVHYRNLYWADGPIADEVLMEQHRQVYRASFPAAKFAHNIQIPRRPDVPHRAGNRAAGSETEDEP